MNDNVASDRIEQLRVSIAMGSASILSMHQDR